MSFLTALHVLNIIAIMSLIFYIRHIQGNKPYSLFWSVIFFVFCLSATGIKWFISHPLHLVRQVLFIVMIAINIVLIGQLMDNNIFHRPAFLLALSPVAWFCVMLCNHFYEERHKKFQ